MSRYASLVVTLLVLSSPWYSREVRSTHGKRTVNRLLVEVRRFHRRAFSLCKNGLHFTGETRGERIDEIILRSLSILLGFVLARGTLRTVYADVLFLRSSVCYDNVIPEPHAMCCADKSAVSSACVRTLSSLLTQPSAARSTLPRRGFISTLSTLLNYGAV